MPLIASAFLRPVPFLRPAGWAFPYFSPQGWKKPLYKRKSGKSHSFIIHPYTIVIVSLSAPPCNPFFSLLWDFSEKTTLFCSFHPFFLFFRIIFTGMAAILPFLLSRRLQTNLTAAIFIVSLTNKRPAASARRKHLLESRRSETLCHDLAKLFTFHLFPSSLFHNQSHRQSHLNIRFFHRPFHKPGTRADFLCP